VGGLRYWKCLCLEMLRGCGDSEVVKMGSERRALPKADWWCGLMLSEQVACMCEPR
jgi:hypothetical protein